MTVKRCSHCHLEFPATTEFFYANKGGKFGLFSRCKACRKLFVDAYINSPEGRAKRRAHARKEVDLGLNAERSRKWRAAHKIDG